jgi:Protein of unknown function (DUF3040)
MPLSEHEQRLLDQIERQLYADDPKFASTVRAHDLRSHLVKRIKRFVALLLLGLAALVAGTVLRNVVIGVAGFLVMLAAGLVVGRSLTRLSSGERTRGKSKVKGPRTSFRERAEERFRRRFEGDGDR